MSALEPETTGQLSVATITMMDVPLLPGSASHALVGRGDELATLVALTGIRPDAAIPAVRAVLLAGDAGVGKTRLLTELRDVAFTEGWQVVAGHCLDFGDSALPYLPFSEIIGRLVADHPDLVDAVTEQHPALDRLRPGRRMLGEESAGSLDRGALYDAVHALLEAAAERQPLLLVIEDAHWADSSSRDLLSFLFSRPFEAPVSVVASYRSDDLHRRHPLRRQAAEWARIPGVERLQLEPLSGDAVRALVHELHAGPMTEGDVAGIVERADGNAFFVEELVGAATLAGDAELPDDLADLLLLRLERLGPEGQDVVRHAGVAGRRVGHALLATASGLDDAALEVGLRDAVGHHVLVPNRDDTYSFRHALLAEAVYDDLLPGERGRLHAAYAAALRGDNSRGTAAELARHARLAHDLGTALEASVQAGAEAMSVGGPIEAARHYETALELLADPALPDDHGVDVADLGSRAADALVAAGNPPRGLALAVSLLEGLPDEATAEQRATLHAAIASAITVAETRLDPLEHTEAGLAELEDRPTPLRARLLHLHARALAHHHRRDEAHETAVEALGMAETLDLPRLASDITASVAGFDRFDGAVDAADVERALQDAVESATRTGARQAQLRAVWLLGRWHYDRAELDRSREYFERAWQIAVDVGATWAPYGFDSRFSLLLIAHLTGEWDDAVALADVSGQSPLPIPEAILRAGLLTVQAGRGEVAQLGVAPRLRQQWEQDGIIAITAAPATIELHGLNGDRAAVLAVHDDAVETLGRLWRGRFQGQVRLAAVTIAALTHGLGAESSEVRAAVAADADRIREAADAVLRALREDSERWGPEGEAWSVRLRAEHLRLRWLAGVEAPELDELLDVWLADLAGFEALGHVPESARSRTRLATLLQAAGRSGEVAAYADPARAVVERLGARPLLTELASLGSPRTPVARDELTPREREILALVAAGRSNGEIGKQLFIATKTVSVHVSNILAKLGAAGRTEAAAIARRDWLL